LSPGKAQFGPKTHQPIIQPSQAESREPSQEAASQAKPTRVNHCAPQSGGSRVRQLSHATCPPAPPDTRALRAPLLLRASFHHARVSRISSLFRMGPACQRPANQTAPRVHAVPRIRAFPAHSPSPRDFLSRARPTLATWPSCAAFLLPRANGQLTRVPLFRNVMFFSPD